MPYQITLVRQRDHANNCNVLKLVQRGLKVISS